MGLFNRLLNFDIESYIVFKENVKTIEKSEPVDGDTKWVKKFHLMCVDIKNGEERLKLAKLWCKAYPGYKTICDDDNGSLCFSAAYGESYVGMLWMGDNGNFMFGRIGSLFKQEKNKAVYHHIYVRETARGNNLQYGLRLFALRTARKRDVGNIYAFVGCKNFSSIKNFIGFSDSYRLIYHIAIDVGPIKLDLHPKLSIEKWISLEKG